MTQPNTIRKLSDAALLKRLNALAERERVTTLEILLHLGEVDRRDLYLAQGFSSLFAYCTGHLGFSESAAGRRVRAARCIGKHPEICTLLRGSGFAPVIYRHLLWGVAALHVAVK